MELTMNLSGRSSPPDARRAESSDWAGSEAVYHSAYRQLRNGYRYNNGHIAATHFYRMGRSDSDFPLPIVPHHPG